MGAQPSKRGDWRQRLAVVDELMRNVSKQTDPQELVLMYGEAVERMSPVDLYLALSRRGLEPPYYRITRNSRWEEDINPWTQRDRLPVLSGGILGEWLYGGRPLVIQDFRVDETDPHAELLRDIRSVAVVPHYDNGEAINLSISMFKQPGAIDEDDFPFQVWRMNLFGRATHNLMLRKELAAAYEALDRELQVVGAIQRSLLPAALPTIATLDLSAHYRTSERAGGDYYDLFPLADDRWGMFIADVSGHGTPAAVIMAVTHALAHSHPTAPDPPSEVLARLNRVLHDGYTRGNGTFVTAFYGVFDSRRRTLRYSNAGHNPPRLRRAGGGVHAVDGATSLPLGVLGDVTFSNDVLELSPGDSVVLYTDGISEAMNAAGELLGTQRMDMAIEAGADRGAEGIVEAIKQTVARFSGHGSPRDDQTVLVGMVR